VLIQVEVKYKYDSYSRTHSTLEVSCAMQCKNAVVNLTWLSHSRQYMNKK